MKLRKTPRQKRRMQAKKQRSTPEPTKETKKAKAPAKAKKKRATRKPTESTKVVTEIKGKKRTTRKTKKIEANDDNNY